ncbi:MAG: zf-HC2 domain-containing protein [Acidobacteria bacterium]|nr:zf-HC2 domain-containing protein [Acidobacteriota bacterium]
MECRAVITLLSDYLDDQEVWLSESDVRDITNHLGKCSKCWNVKHELDEIRVAARELPLHTPGRAIWTRISNIVEVEVPTSKRPTRVEAPDLNRWAWIRSHKFTFNLPQLAGAAVVALALLFVGVINLSNPAENRFDMTGATTAVFLPDEDRIKAELTRRLDAINARKSKWDPEMREEFERHLKMIEDSLQHSRQLLDSNPADKVQQQMVLSLYQEKRQLLDDVERLKW